MSKHFLSQPGRSPASKRQNETFSNSPQSSSILTRGESSVKLFGTTHSTIPESDMRKFLDTEVVVPKLSKMPDISKYLGKSRKMLKNKNKSTDNRNSVIDDYM